MFSVTSLWIPFTIIAALGQVARNAMQRSLTGPLGTWGATNIRFLFGFPFSLLFLALVLIATGDHMTAPPAMFWPWLLLGALSQIFATGLMLLAMNARSFVVTTAYLKTEAIQTAIFGFVFLGDHLTWLKVMAIVIATVGVVVTGWNQACPRVRWRGLRPHPIVQRPPGSRCLWWTRGHRLAVTWGIRVAIGADVGLVPGIR